MIPIDILIMAACVHVCARASMFCVLNIFEAIYAAAVN